MPKRRPHPIILLILLVLALSGCDSLPLPERVSPTPELSATPTETPIPTPLPTPTPTPTPLPPLLVLLVPPEADPELASALQSSFAELSQQAGLRWQIRQTISAAETTSDVAYLIALPPAEGLNELVAAAPNTRFLAAGIPGLEPAPNLLAIGSEEETPDQNGFLAGYIAAMITRYWRAGVIGVEDTPEGQAARISFQNGVRYFCGLCRSGVPPFYEYPISVRLPAGSSEAEWRALADFLIDRVVETVYVAPGAGGDDLLRYLTQAGVNVIGGVRPPDDIRDRWVVSIRNPDLDGIYLEYWPLLLEGETGQALPLRVSLADINPELFSPGKQRMAEELLTDLEAGYIDTGVTPEAP